MSIFKTLDELILERLEAFGPEADLLHNATVKHVQMKNGRFIALWVHEAAESLNRDFKEADAVDRMRGLKK